MVLIACLAMMPMQQVGDATEIVRDELGRLPTFVLEGVSNTAGTSFLVSGRAIRRSDGASALMTVNRIRDTSDAKLYWVSTGSATGPIEPQPAFSGLPIGENAQCSSSGGASHVRAHDGPVFVKVTIHFRGQPGQTGTTWISSDPEADRIRCERLGRRTLARIRGLKAQAAGTVNLSGSTAACVTGPRGERLVDLSRYCELLGLQLSTNESLGTASFTVGGEQVIIPLAAKKIKDGARWIETTDISLIKDGKWYVSYAALQSARGQ